MGLLLSKHAWNCTVNKQIIWETSNLCNINFVIFCIYRRHTQVTFVWDIASYGQGSLYQVLSQIEILCLEKLDSANCRDYANRTNVHKSSVKLHILQMFEATGMHQVHTHGMERVKQNLSKEWGERQIFFQTLFPTPGRMSLQLYMFIFGIEGGKLFGQRTRESVCSKCPCNTQQIGKMLPFCTRSVQFNKNNPFT